MGEGEYSQEMKADCSDCRQYHSSTYIIHIWHQRNAWLFWLVREYIPLLQRPAYAVSAFVHLHCKQLIFGLLKGCPRQIHSKLWRIHDFEIRKIKMKPESLSGKNIIDKSHHFCHQSLGSWCVSFIYHNWTVYRTKHIPQRLLCHGKRTPESLLSIVMDCILIPYIHH